MQSTIGTKKVGYIKKLNVFIFTFRLKLEQLVVHKYQLQKMKNCTTIILNVLTIQNLLILDGRPCIKPI